MVVLGHTGCWAVRTTVAEIESPDPDISPGLREIVATVRPAVEPLLASSSDRETLLGEAVRANVDHSINRLRSSSRVLDLLVRNDGLRVVGAE